MLETGAEMSMCGDGRGRGSTLSPLYNRQTGTVAHPRAGAAAWRLGGAHARLGDTLRSATGDGCPSPEQLEEEERDNAYDKAVGSSRSWSTAASISPAGWVLSGGSGRYERV